MKASLTITGLVVGILGVLMAKFGTPIAEGNLEITINTIAQIGGALMVLVGRVRHGDLKFLLFKKGVAPKPSEN